jgi:AraC-like DNA-binding protein
VFQPGSQDEFPARFEAIIAQMEGGAAADADRAALLLEGLLLECSLDVRKNNRLLQDDPMPRIREALISSIYGEIDLLQIAADHHISLSTLRRLVRRSSGFPLHEYVHRLKMAEAKNLLLNTSLQVKEIAGLLHYNDTFYFSRLFKRIMGVSPQQCRSNI